MNFLILKHCNNYYDSLNLTLTKGFRKIKRLESQVPVRMDWSFSITILWIMISIGTDELATIC